MNRNATVLVAAALVVATVAAVPGAGTAAGDTPPAAVADATGQANETIRPGERLQGVVGVQQAEIGGEIETRAFGIAFAAAGSNASKAAVVGGKVSELRERIERLEHRKAELEAARANGSMTEGEFRAEMAEVATELATVRRLANRTEAATRRLPAAALEREGINVTAIRTLRRDARNLSGPEIAEIARSIAGPGVGRPVLHAGELPGPGRPNGTGVPGGPPNATGSPGGPPDRDNVTRPGPPGKGNDTDRRGAPGNDTEGARAAIDLEGRSGATIPPAVRRGLRGLIG